MTLSPSLSRVTCDSTSRGRAFEEEPLENGARLIIGRKRDAGAIDGKRRAGGRKDQRGNARLAADLFGGKLIHRDRIAKGAAARMRSAGEKGGFARVSAVHFRMRDAGKEGQVVTDAPSGGPNTRVLSKSRPAALGKRLSA